MTLTLIVVAWALWRYVSPRHALWTVLILSSCVLVVMAAKAGLTDSVLLLFVTVAQLCLYAVWRGRGTWGVTVVMALAIALALLTKGPVAVGVQVMTLAGPGGAEAHAATDGGEPERARLRARFGRRERAFLPRGGRDPRPQPRPLDNRKPEPEDASAPAPNALRRGPVRLPSCSSAC